MKRGARLRIFSLKRLVLSIVLGFLLPLSYAVILSLASDLTGRVAPEFLVTPFGWPRRLWIFLLGRHPSDYDVVGGLVFMALSNIALYGAAAYAVLLAVSVIRRKRVVLNPPPTPEHFNSDAVTPE